MHSFTLKVLDLILEWIYQAMSLTSMLPTSKLLSSLKKGNSKLYTKLPTKIDSMALSQLIASITNDLPAFGKWSQVNMYHG